MFDENENVDETTNVESNDYESIISEELGNLDDDQDGTNEQTETDSDTDDDLMSNDDLMKAIGIEPDAEESEQTDEDSTPDMSELSLGDKTYQIPKAVKEAYDNGSMMQADYTKKTQALAEERQAMVAEFEKTHNEKLAQVDQLLNDNTEKIQTYNQWDHILSMVEKTRPELWEEIQEVWSENAQHYNNPVVNQLRNENQQLHKTVNDALQKINESGDRREMDSIRKDYDSGMTNVVSKYGKKMESLGIKIDFTNDVRIKQQYANGWNHQEDRGLTPEEAFLQAYAPEMSAAMSSKLKVDGVRRKVAKSKKVPTSGSIRGGSFDATKIDMSGSYEDVANNAMSAFG